MRTFYNYTRRDCTFEETPRGYYNSPDCIEWTFRRRTHKAIISDGSSDYVDVFRDGKDLCVLSYNYRLDYVGLEIFELEPSGPYDEDSFNDSAGDVFFQSPHEEECLGPKWHELSTRTLAKRLFALIGELQA